MRFTHIYVEERALEYPLANEILAKLPDSKVIKIRHYKEALVPCALADMLPMSSTSMVNRTFFITH